MRLAVLDLWGEPGLRELSAARVSSSTRAQMVNCERVTAPHGSRSASSSRVARGRMGRPNEVRRRRAPADGGSPHPFRLRARAPGAPRRLVGPIGVIRRASELWRHDHSHGSLAVTVANDGQSAAATLSEATSSAARRSPDSRSQGVPRYIVTLSRGVKTASETHGLTGSSVSIRVTWD